MSKEGPQPRHVTVATAVGMATIIVTILVAIFTQLTGRIDKVEASVIDKGERVASLESSFAQVDKRLERIETKIDLILSGRYETKK